MPGPGGNDITCSPETVYRVNLEPGGRPKNFIFPFESLNGFGNANIPPVEAVFGSGVWDCVGDAVGVCVIDGVSSSVRVMVAVFVMVPVITAVSEYVADGVCETVSDNVCVAVMVMVCVLVCVMDGVSVDVCVIVGVAVARWTKYISSLPRSEFWYAMCGTSMLSRLSEAFMLSAVRETGNMNIWGTPPESEESLFHDTPSQ